MLGRPGRSQPSASPPSAEVEQTRIGQAIGRLNVSLALVWAGTTVAAAVAAKASTEFIWIILLLICGASASGACVEAARRRIMTH